MELYEALGKVKYPADKYVSDETKDPEILAFNEGWNELHHQLMMIAKSATDKGG